MTAREKYIHEVVRSMKLVRPWFQLKVIVVMWPGRVEDFEKTRLTDFCIYPFSTHLEAGIFLDMHPAGWSYRIDQLPTLPIDLTLPSFMNWSNACADFLPKRPMRF